MTYHGNGYAGVRWHANVKVKLLIIYGYPRKTGVSQMISEKEQDNKCLAFVLHKKWNMIKESITMKRLENKTAIVTGGNSGIGKATAILFAKEGADLVLCARRKEALDEVAEECRKYGVQVVTVKADVSSHEDCSAVVKAAVDTFGKVDILVNNAGIVDKHRPITECTDEWWNEIIAIDQSSLFYMMKDTIPHMMASGKGSIINVSSIGGVFGNGGISYSAAKSAALAMTKNVAIQLAPNGIRCNAVCPGPTPTPLNTPEKVAEFSTWFAERCAQHMDMSLPESSVEDQANAILFFAEDASAAVTGQYLIVDHGTTL